MIHRIETYDAMRDSWVGFCSTGNTGVGIYLACAAPQLKGGRLLEEPEARFWFTQDGISRFGVLAIGYLRTLRGASGECPIHGHHRLFGGPPLRVQSVKISEETRVVYRDRHQLAIVGATTNETVWNPTA